MTEQEQQQEEQQEELAQEEQEQQQEEPRRNQTLTAHAETGAVGRVNLGVNQGVNQGVNRRHVLVARWPQCLALALALRSALRQPVWALGVVRET